MWLIIALQFIIFTANSTAQAQEATLPELVRRVKPAVVSVVTYNAKNEALTTGSGFFIRPGEVVTNFHVVEGAQRAAVHTFDGKGKTYSVTGLLDVDEDGDLVVLRVNSPADRARTLEVTDELPEEGENIFVIGNPLRLEGSVSNGIVSAVREVPGLGRIIQITAPVSQGSSGSPLFNMKGQVVGVVTVKVTNGQNINLALAASRIKKMRAGKLLSFDDLAARNRAGQQQQAEILAEWWYRNGLNSLWIGNYTSALGYFENAVVKNPNRAEAWLQVGYCKVKQGRNRDAIEAYRRAIQLRPTSTEAYNKLGDAYYYAGSFREAVEAYKQAACLRPDLGEAYYNLGMIYLEAGDRAAAIVQSRTLRPLDIELYKKLISEIER